MSSRQPAINPLKISGASQTATVTEHRREPVIIYAHSPKIIHVRPRDFMALVQRLTGQSPPTSSAHKNDRAAVFDGADLVLFCSPRPVSRFHGTEAIQPDR